MKQSRKRRAVWMAVLWSAFVVFTVLVKLVDVQPIGPRGSRVGFASLNAALLTDYSPFWDKLTEYLGYLSLLIVVFFGFVGLVQLIRQRDLKKVEPAVLLGVFYVLVGIFYMAFEFIALNFRPNPGEHIAGVKVFGVLSRRYNFGVWVIFWPAFYLIFNPALTQEAIALYSFHISPFYWVVWSLSSIAGRERFR